MKHHRVISRMPQTAAIGPGLSVWAQLLLLLTKGAASKFLTIP